MKTLPFPALPDLSKTDTTTAHTPRYRERAVNCYASAESGPFVLLDDGSRIYGLPAAAPALLAALEDVLRYCVTASGFPDNSKGRTTEQQLAYDAARFAIASAAAR